MKKINFKFCNNKNIIKNYCAYSSIGRLCDRYPSKINLFLQLFKKHNGNKNQIIEEISKKHKEMVPLVLVLFKYLYQKDYTYITYLFDNNKYLDKYIEKIIQNKKLSKKDLTIKKYIEESFIDILPSNKHNKKIINILNYINKNINQIYDIKENININVIIIPTIKGISAGCGQYNYIILETNVFLEKLFFHEMIHNLNYNSKFFKKLIKKHNYYEFNEAFTNVLTNIVYYSYKKQPIIIDKYYYNSKKNKLLEDKILSIYLKWTSFKEKESFVEYLFNTL